MKNIDYKIFTADKPGRINTKLLHSASYTVHKKLYTQGPAHKPQKVAVFCRTGLGGLTNDEEEFYVSTYYM